MCGIWGIYSASKQLDSEAIGRLQSTLSYRGPDASSVWSSNDTMICLGHNRLAMLDLSSRSNQPQAFGQEVLTFNGEIYNFKDLRGALLQAHPELSPEVSINSDFWWLGRSIQYLGVNRTLQLVRGMFAFASYNTQSRELVLVTDHFGEKPLYYRQDPSTFAFGSEPSLLRDPFLPSTRVATNAIEDILRFGYIRAPNSIWQGVHRLPPRSILRVDLGGGAPIPAISNYQVQLHDSDYDSEEEALRAISEQIHSAVDLTLSADVEIGAQLSSGVDSSTVAAVASASLRARGTRLKTFTLGFADSQYDESRYSEKIAQQLETDHHVLYLKEDHFRRNIDRLISQMTEPFADASYILSDALSRFTRNHVKGCLGGDGGDELCGGYTRHQILGNTRSIALLANINPLTYIAKERRESVILAATERMTDWRIANLNRFPRSAEKLQKAIRLSTEKTLRAQYLALREYWSSDHFQGSKKADDNIYGEDMTVGLANLQAAAWDRTDFLPNDVLTKTDRTAMRHSLELRSPLLNIELFKIGNTKFGKTLLSGKSALRKIRSAYVKEDIFPTEKRGFSAPINKWMSQQEGDVKSQIFNCQNLSIISDTYKMNLRSTVESFFRGNKSVTMRVYILYILSKWLEDHNASI